MITLEQKKCLLEAYQALVDNRTVIENLAPTEELVINDVLFEPYVGVCSFVGHFTEEHTGSNVYLFSNYIENMSIVMGLDGNYPVPNESFHKDGNMYNTTNPTHNAKGRWEYIEKCISFIKKEIANDEEN